MIKPNKGSSTCFNSARASSLVNTVGKRASFFARVTSPASLRTISANPPPTVPVTKTAAPKTPGSGGFWLEAVTFRSTASEVEKRLDFRLAHFGWVTFLMEIDVTFRPLHIRLSGPQAVML